MPLVRPSLDFSGPAPTTRESNNASGFWSQPVLPSSVMSLAPAHRGSAAKGSLSFSHLVPPLALSHTWQAYFWMLWYSCKAVKAACRVPCALERIAFLRVDTLVKRVSQLDTRVYSLCTATRSVCSFGRPLSASLLHPSCGEIPTSG